jgi:hypothetical protein
VPGAGSGVGGDEQAAIAADDGVALIAERVAVHARDPVLSTQRDRDRRCGRGGGFATELDRPTGHRQVLAQLARGLGQAGGVGALGSLRLRAIVFQRRRHAVVWCEVDDNSPRQRHGAVVRRRRLGAALAAAAAEQQHQRRDPHDTFQPPHDALPSVPARHLPRRGRNATTLKAAIIVP